jgi:hypothetical protein
MLAAVGSVLDLLSLPLQRGQNVLAFAVAVS